MSSFGDPVSDSQAHCYLEQGAKASELWAVVEMSTQVFEIWKCAGRDEPGYPLTLSELVAVVHHSREAERLRDSHNQSLLVAAGISVE